MSTPNLPALPERADLLTRDVAAAIEEAVAAILPDITDRDMLAEWRARAEALVSYLRDREARPYMQGALRRIEARIGQLLGPPARTGRPPTGSPKRDEDFSALDDMQRRAFRAMGAALEGGKLTDDQWRDSRAGVAREIAAAGADDPDVAAQIRAGLLPGKKYKHIDDGDAYEPYGTPPRYLEAARAALGGIDLDPATSAIAQERVKAATYYTAEDDGLAHDWVGTVWLNPPYGALMAKFLDKLVRHYDTGEVTAGIILVSLHAISAGWTALLFDADLICITDHRIPFIRDDGKPPSTPYGSVFAYYGPEPGRFAEHFDQFGYLLTQYRGA